MSFFFEFCHKYVTLLINVNMTEQTPKKDYKPAELEIVAVDQTDIICTSSSIMSLDEGDEL